MKRYKILLASLLAMLMLVPTTVYAKKNNMSDDEYQAWQEEWGSQRIELSDTSVILYLKGDKEDKTWELNYTTDPNDEDVKWASSDDKIATVNSSGLVTAKKVGTCTITCTGRESERTATCSVTVKNDIVPVEEIKINNDGMVTVAKGKQKKLPFTLKPSGHTSVKFFSKVDDTSICYVDNDGNVRGIAEGDTNVTIWFKNEVKGESEITNLSREEADFIATFEVTVLDWDMEKLNDFIKDYEGFQRMNSKDLDDKMLIEVKDVGWICYDPTLSKYCKGWQTIGNKRYYFEEKKCQTVDANQKTKSATFYVMKTDWLKDGSKWYLFNKDGEMQTGWVSTNGKRYYLDTVNGDMKTGRVSVGGKYYWLLDDGTAVERWYTHTDGKTYYGNPLTCELPVGFFLVDGKWYYADPVDFSVLKNQWIVDSDGSYYYLTESGEMLINGTTPDGYFCGADGRWVQ